VSQERDPYAYPDLDVLRNRPGIRDAKQLQEFEYRKSTERILELAENPIKGRFDLEHLKAIHKHVFQDVYEWAGQIRTVQISKGASVFAMPGQVESYSKQVFDGLARDKHLKGMDKERFTERLAHHYAEINAVHPFREGNGRSTRVFVDQLAREAGFELDYSKVDAQRWNEAARHSFAGNLGPAKEVFAHIAVPARAAAFDRDTPEDALKKHPELRGAFMTLKAAEAYAAKAIGDPLSRSNFVRETRASIAATLAAGKDVPEPAMKTKQEDRER
jgi:cell filamentation protein